MKTEICENMPSLSAPVTLSSLFKDMNSQMRIIEDFSNEKIESLETQNKQLKADKENLQKENEKLKSLLAAKERDYHLYYNQYQKISKEHEDLKAKGKQTIAVEPLEDTNSDYIDEKLSETMLFTTPDAETVWCEPVLAPQSIADISISKPRNILKARKRSRTSTSNIDVPSKKISKPSPIPKHFKCSICPKENREVMLYDDIHDYRNHVMKVHPKRILCDLCPYNGQGRTDLTRHKHTVHAPDIKSVGFDCALCNISYSGLSVLNQHIRLYH